MKHTQGFTLIEILTALVIITILVAMAMPLYEKTVERSRLAEARTVLAKLAEAKQYAMDNMGCTTYSPNNDNCPKLKHLNIGFVDWTKEAGSTGKDKKCGFETDHFIYSIAPGPGTANWNSVCANRRGGDYGGTIFLYTLEPGDNKTPTFECKGSNCTNYGMEQTSRSVACSL